MAPTREPIGPEPAPRPKLLPPSARAPFAGPKDPEDFRVEEVPVEQPGEAGEYLYLWVEKRRLSTEEARGLLARALSVPASKVRAAGRKDVHALTRQWFSAQGVETERARALLDRDLLDGPERPSPARLRCLRVGRGARGLYLGKLLGNRFALRLRDLEEDGLQRLGKGLSELQRAGVPAWFGAQRQGLFGRTGAVGVALLAGDFQGALARWVARPLEGEHGPVREAREAAERGEWERALVHFPRSFRAERALCQALARGATAEAALGTVPRADVEFAASAAQSLVFDRTLSQRFLHLGVLEAGDVAYLHQSRGSFVVVDPAAEQVRADRLEISPTGALPGRRVRPAARGRPGEWEREALVFAGLCEADFERHLPSREGPFRVEGARRPLRWPIAEVEFESLGAGQAELRFFLPPGAYATEVLGELQGAPDRYP